MSETDADAAVRAQYEALPYPARDPTDERRRLIEGSPSHLAELNHYVFGGRRDFTQPIRVLVAGGGTGDATIMLAQHLADAGSPGRVVYADPSIAARHVAECRAAIRGLGNISFHTAAIEDLPALALGPFDYIDCCGVLHHLADPAHGLRTLAGLLTPDGGLGLMFYGPLGRTGVYAAQDLVRLLVPEGAPAERAQEARRIVADLPASNWLKRNPFVGDYLSGGDAGVFDLLLHVRDRAYAVPEILALASSCGLAVTAFIEPAAYDPNIYVASPQVRRRLVGLTAMERVAAAELIAGNMAKHVFYAVPAERRDQAVARLDDPSMIPILRAAEGNGDFLAIKPGIALTVAFNGIKARFPLPDLAQPILRQIDGTRTVDQVVAETAAHVRLDPVRVRRALGALYGVLNGIGRMYLKQGNAPVT